MEQLKDELIENEFYMKHNKTKVYLTNKRLVFQKKHNEESYPLSKITAIKVLFQRNYQLLLISLFECTAIIFWLLFREKIWQSINLEGYSVVFGILIMGMLLTTYYWIIGQTDFVIIQLGGEKKISAIGKNEPLKELSEKLNSKLF